MFLAFLYVTYVSILTCDTSSMLHNMPSTAYTTLRYHLLVASPRLRYMVLAPLHFRRKVAYLD